MSTFVLYRGAQKGTQNSRYILPAPVAEGKKCLTQLAVTLLPNTLQLILLPQMDTGNSYSSSCSPGHSVHLCQATLELVGSLACASLEGSLSLWPGLNIFPSVDLRFVSGYFSSFQVLLTKSATIWFINTSLYLLPSNCDIVKKTV